MEVLPSGRQVNGHHGLAAHEVVLLLETDPRRGLAGVESRSRRERCGPKALPQEAADMVLTDDDFATIEAAVEEGRGVFDNRPRGTAPGRPG